MFNLILDSGAFSAWMKEESIDVKKYAEFILGNLDVFDTIVGVDIIPGTFGQRTIRQNEQEEAARRGWINYLNMVYHYNIPSSKILHVFHHGENFKWLKKTISRMNYIGLSPANDCSPKSKIRWLDECMDYVCENGSPIVKFHGFGVTSADIMHRYPWHSVDSSSWVTFSRYGTILIPQLDPNGNFIYNKPPHPIQVTRRAPTRKQDNLKHYDNLPNEMKAVVAKYVHDKGFDLGKSYIRNGKEIVHRHGVMTNHRLRDLFNLKFYIDAAKSAGIKFVIAGNFPQMGDKALEKECFDMITENGDEYNRLVSYWYENYARNVMEVKSEIQPNKKRR